MYNMGNCDILSSAAESQENVWHFPVPGESSAYLKDGNISREQLKSGVKAWLFVQASS